MGDDEQAQVDMDIAINTQMTADSLRKMGFDEAGDVFHEQAHWAAQEAIRHGYKDEPSRPEPLPGEQTTMGPYDGSGPGLPEPPEWPEYDPPPEPYVPEIVD